MTILHYFLGFPPYRSGGMTKFAYDLMEAQVNDGEKVVALWPGKMNLILPPKVKIKKRKPIKEIENYEIINPLPISLDEGIENIKEFTKECNRNIYIEFFKTVNPEAIHIHTLMGMHKELIDAANQLGIRTIFTTHDYFGICPKVTLYKSDGVCDNDNNCKDCAKCNQSALSIEKIKIMQSPLYRKYKNIKLIKLLRKKHRNNFFEEDEKNFIKKKYDDNGEKYQKLRQYYVDILEKIDIIHFNSNLTKNIYLRYIVPKSYKVITISHKNIEDNRKNKSTNSSKIRFTFLASTKPYKGFYMLKEVMDELYSEKKYEFELNVYSSFISNKKEKYIKIYEDGFQQEELENIFSKTDILIAPSLWYETFGFTVLEALSYGVPVIISDNVGAKDIVRNAGIIVKANDKYELRKAIETCTKEKIKELRKNALEEIQIKKFYEFVDETKKYIYGVENDKEKKRE